MKLVEIVKGIAVVNCYRDGELWYDVERYDPEVMLNGVVFKFPVPIKDTGTGIFESQMKAITLMRWIRKQLEKEQCIMRKITALCARDLILLKDSISNLKVKLSCSSVASKETDVIIKRLHELVDEKIEELDDSKAPPYGN